MSSIASENSSPLDRLLKGNVSYAERTRESDPSFFDTLATGQTPEVLWIGCADSRVPETTVSDCKPGDIFVHRNIANVVHAEDISSGSVIEYAVKSLRVKRIVVCGHTSCGGANASLSDKDLGPTLNGWLRPVRELRKRHSEEIEALPQCARGDRLAELNVQQSVLTITHNPTVQAAIKEGLTVHGIIFDLKAGTLKVLDEIHPEPCQFYRVSFGTLGIKVPEPEPTLVEVSHALEEATISA